MKIEMESHEEIEKEIEKLSISTFNVRSKQLGTKEVSEQRGVCARYLVGRFVLAARVAAIEVHEHPEVYKLQLPMADVKQPKFYDLAPVICNGNKSKGYNKICPRDGKPG